MELMNIIKIMETTTITITKKMKDKIKSVGKMGDTYEDVLKRVLKVK